MWREAIKTVQSNTGQWILLREMGTRRSAQATYSMLQTRFPEILWANWGRRIYGHSARSPSIYELAREKDRVGHETYGDVWTNRGTPAHECKDELADALNYVQWSLDQGQLSIDQATDVSRDIVRAFQKLREYSEAPPIYHGLAQNSSRPGLPQKFKMVRTIRGEEKWEE